MTPVITIIHVLVCLILILVILLQAGRGQGLTGPSFGSGNVQSLFGTGAADFLTKATSVAAICFLFTSIGLNFLEVRKSKSLLEFSKKSSQVDMDAIKKALEKVKEGEDETKTKAEEPPAQAVPESRPRTEAETAVPAKT